MDTVVTPLTESWTDLTAIWVAASPAAADGEVIVVQPSEGGIAHAIVVVQAAAEPAGGAGGHLVGEGRKLRVTVSTGRKHYARAYTGSATLIATGEGVT